jgi:hypothetical protein
VVIDIGFDFRTDAGGKDPDSHSPTLRNYHRLLWSKPLPSGEFFDLSDTTRGVYLHHRSALGEFFLSSDSVMQTFLRWPALKPITDQLPESENEAVTPRTCPEKTPSPVQALGQHRWKMFPPFPTSSLRRGGSADRSPRKSSLSA